MKRLIVAVLIVAVIAGGVAGLAFVNFAGGSSNGDEVKLVIRPGWNAARIADELERQKVVASAMAFRIYLRLRGGEQDLRAGEYELRTKMSFTELAGELKKGPELKYVKLRIPEGFNAEQTAARVEEQTHITAADFASAAVVKTAKPAIAPEGVSSLEGFLYPRTYYVIERETATDLVKRLVAQFEKETSKADWNRASAFGLTPYQMLIIASMIEEEAKLDEERAKVAAVIHNRLSRGMKLEIDATVQYVVKKYGGEPLTQSDLEVDSPYNTRRYAGLPPGPIASPRAKSIIAALSPADSNALFYVLTPDCKSHVFTADYNEFLRAKQQRTSC